jgi:hypothetical protein
MPRRSANRWIRAINKQTRRPQIAKLTEYNMKFITNKILLALAVLAAAVSATAGQYGIDAYAGMRTVLPSTTPTVLAASNGAGGKTNGPIDKFNWVGDAKIDFFSWTNAQVNTVVATVQGSSDSTNWVALTNFSLATASTLNITNTAIVQNGTWYFGTNAIVTDNYLYPFAITTPQAFIAGWAAPYPLENQFTNSGTFTLTGNGMTEVGFRTIDQPRYLQIIWTASGAGTTNVTCFSAITTPVSNIQP